MGARYLTAEEVGDILEISPKTVYYRANKGKLKFKKIGNKMFFDSDDLVSQTRSPSGRKRSTQKRKQVSNDSEQQMIDFDAYTQVDSMGDLRIFKSPHFGDLSVILRNGEPWFIAKELSEILEYKSVQTMTRRLDNNEKADMQILHASSQKVEQMRNTTILNESGLYNAMFGSKKKEAKEFRRWVTSEVLPSLRKSGKYVIDDKDGIMKEYYNDLTPEERNFIKSMMSNMKQYKQKIAKIEEEKMAIERQSYVDNAIKDIPKSHPDVRGTVHMTLGSKALHRPKMGRNTLFRVLRENGILMKNNEPYQKYINLGYFIVKQKPYKRKNGHKYWNTRTDMTYKGYLYIDKLLRNLGYLTYDWDD